MASALLLASCSNEEPAVVVNQDPESADVELSENALVTHEDGLDVQDVKIVSGHSATMTISNKCLEEKDITLKAGNALCVWRAVDQVPFVRVIDAVSDNGATTTITSHAGNVADVISIDVQDYHFDCCMRCFLRLPHMGMKIITDTAPAIRAQVTGIMRLKTMSTFSLAMTIENHLIA